VDRSAWSFRGRPAFHGRAQTHKRRPENDDGPSACKPRPTIVGTRYLGRLRNNPSTPLTYATNAEDLKDGSRKHFDGAVTVHRQECLEYCARSTGTGTFGAAQSGANEGCCTTDKDAPIALHKCRRPYFGVDYGGDGGPARLRVLLIYLVIRKG
jgi:hypothetical protein